MSKYFNTHIRLNDGYGDHSAGNCYRYQLFSREGTRCERNGYFDAGHTAGFNAVNGHVYYGGTPNGTELAFTTAAGSVLRGTIPSRASGDFTITEFRVPEFGTLARPSQKLHLNVTSEGFGLTGDAWQDFYLSGNLDVAVPATGNGTAGLLDDLFGGLSRLLSSGSASD
ncbi:hypothetical protein [Rhodococcoides yunnanense]|uniref:hypothetical protein n=1 Tax=Rhodococcoides yunnanense TaxID=278209 RepID=UPI000934338A|nr:hypothetical protein [Rhodococcus yunnanensis]